MVAKEGNVFSIFLFLSLVAPSSVLGIFMICAYAPSCFKVRLAWAWEETEQSLDPDVYVSQGQVNIISPYFFY